jgi:hypothetical protein
MQLKKRLHEMQVSALRLLTFHEPVQTLPSWSRVLVDTATNCPTSERKDST